MIIACYWVLDEPIHSVVKVTGLRGGVYTSTFEQRILGYPVEDIPQSSHRYLEYIYPGTLFTLKTSTPRQRSLSFETIRAIFLQPEQDQAILLSFVRTSREDRH